MRKQKTPTQPYEKPWKRTARDTQEERDMGYARLKDYGHGRSVQLFWDLNADAQQDKICKLIIDGKEIYLDSEELLKYLRWV